MYVCMLCVHVYIHTSNSLTTQKIEYVLRVV